MKRRLSIGMAIVGDPPIVFLDEATAGLDPENKHIVWGLIQVDYPLLNTHPFTHTLSHTLSHTPFHMHPLIHPFTHTLSYTPVHTHPPSSNTRPIGYMDVAHTFANPLDIPWIYIIPRHGTLSSLLIYLICCCLNENIMYLLYFLIVALL